MQFLASVSLSDLPSVSNVRKCLEDDFFFSGFKLLLKFFMYLMHRGLAGFQDVVDCKTLTYPQVNCLTVIIITVPSMIFNPARVGQRCNRDGTVVRPPACL